MDDQPISFTAPSRPLDVDSLPTKSTITSYRLLDHGVRYKGESVRLMFQYHKVPYEDISVPLEKLERVFSESPTGQLPILKINALGVSTFIGSTTTIRRHLAKTLNLESEFGGSTPMEITLCDMNADIFDDLLKVGMTALMGTTERFPIMARSLETLCNRLLPVLNKRMKITGAFLTGDKVLYCDILAVTNLSLMEESLKSLFVPLLAHYEYLVKYYFRMRELPELKDYIDNNWPKAAVSIPS